MADDKKRSRSTKQTKNDSPAGNGNNNNNSSTAGGNTSSSSGGSNSRRHRGSSQKQSKKKDDNPDLDFAHCLIQLQQPVNDQKSESDPNIERVTCSAVKIGSYRAVPHGPVIFTSQCIDIDMPSLNDSNLTTKLRIPYSQMVKIFVHYYRSGPVFFMYATAPMGTKIRDTLKMNSKSGPYYDPLSKVETQKRIILFTERISEDVKSKIKSILNNVSKNLFEEFSNREATDVLNVCAPDEVQHMFKKSQATQAAAPVISKGTTKKVSTQTIMMYPPSPSKGSISISVQDYSCLGEDQCVNEVIVDFYLKYLMENVLSGQDQGRTYLLSSGFYKQLINDFSNKGLSNSSEDEPLAIYTEKRHSSRIKRITKSVNVFTKDFIIVPVCSKNLCWMVAIICFPHLTGPVKFHGSSINSYASSKSKRKHSALIEDFPNKDTSIRSDIDTEEDEGYDVHEGWDEQGGCLDERESHDKLKHNDHRSSNNNSSSSNNNNSNHRRHSNSKSSSNKSNSSSKLSSHDAIRQPCILVFDPTSSSNKTQVISLLRDYLRIEYKANYGYDRDFSETALKSVTPKIPLCTNSNDSGLYVLQYVQSFFQNPITDFRLPINMLQNWFTLDVITYKRYKLQKLLHRLMEKQDIDIVSLNLPDLNLQSPVGAVEAEFEDMEDKDDEDEDYNCGESMECDDDEEEEEEGEEDEDDSESEETIGKNSLRRTRKSSDLEQNQQDRTTKDKDKSEKETEAPERENKDKKKSHSSKQPSKYKSSNSRSTKRSSSSQKQQKRKATGGRGSLDEMPYNPPKTRLTALREKEDAAAQMEHQSSPNVDQPRRSPKKNML